MTSRTPLRIGPPPYLPEEIPVALQTWLASLVNVQAWQPLTLQNGWTNFGSPFADAKYYRDPFGIVRVVGLITGGTTTSGTVLFTLPENFRPADQYMYEVLVGGNALGRVDLLANGDLTIVAGNNTFLSLFPITFRAEQ